MKQRKYEYKRDADCSCCNSRGYIREVEGKDFCGWCGSFQEVKTPEPKTKAASQKKTPAKKPVAKKPKPE